ncbi:uncharacterized protein VICG_01656 [Vittaforma corneae ATCC 50505]|uniref:S1 motif domain-containing protein n=1 Tax=Vittaforma corneae (strain ATCC 50505) TaxID=993615 RepID=L2GK75_VITCO|nr:uncharacterized protein VICG_01656 [Vittaforma corneae ATCC 50505]ELA41283.1 hypothetical protein VICG_01656 [Vittaforma corneae ATCC 50505]
MKIERIRHVFPGDHIPEKGFKCYGIVEGRAVIIGTLCKVEDLYFIMAKTKIYVPKQYDVVIGRVVYASQDYYKVDLGSCTGILPALSFANATKRNRPELEKENTVLCQVERVSDGDALLSCKKEGLGAIDECFPIESWKIRLLYFNNVLQKLSKNRSFRIALAINGFVWIDADAETKREVLREIERYGTENENA